MPQLSYIKSFIALVLIVFCVSANAATPQSAARVQFRIVNDYQIIVRVAINGSSPVELLLDTGSNRTLIDQELAHELALPVAGDGKLSNTLSDSKVSVVHTGSISMAGSAVAGLNLLCPPRMDNLPDHVRGVLGEDFLSHFDILIDYRNHYIELDSAAGSLPTSSLVDTLAGEHLPIQLQGTVDGNPVANRLILTARAGELGDKPMSLLLDSAASSLTLFGGPSLLGGDAVVKDFSAEGPFSTAGVQIATRTLHVQFSSAAVSTMITLAPPAISGMDSDGLLPTATFRSIFISHSGHFVILNPTATKPLIKPTLTKAGL